MAGIVSFGGYVPFNRMDRSFEDCRVPAENLLGKENTGFIYLMIRLHGGISHQQGLP